MWHFHVWFTMNLINPVVRESLYEFFGASPNEVQDIHFSQIEPVVTITYSASPADPEYYRQYTPPFEESVSLQHESGPLEQSDGTYETTLRIRDTRSE